jgi:inhibitor of KinA sporulation pathway (predicted exonuclease)
MGKNMDRRALVIDVEATCWEPPEVQPANEISEIIEIGIAVVNIDNREIEKNDSILVRPQKSKVSKFCTKLTTLTQEQVDKGVTFQEAMKTLRDEYDSQNRLFVSWGDYDRKMFERNCKDYGVKYPFGPRHMNLKNAFAVLNGLDREVGLDSALPYYSLTLEGTHHRGVDDAKNIAKIFQNIVGIYRTGTRQYSIKIPSTAE